MIKSSNQTKHIDMWGYTDKVISMCQTRERGKKRHQMIQAHGFKVTKISGSINFCHNMLLIIWPFNENHMFEKKSWGIDNFESFDRNHNQMIFCLDFMINWKSRNVLFANINNSSRFHSLMMMMKTSRIATTTIWMIGEIPICWWNSKPIMIIRLNVNE